MQAPVNPQSGLFARLNPRSFRAMFKGWPKTTRQPQQASGLYPPGWPFPFHPLSENWSAGHLVMPMMPNTTLSRTGIIRPSFRPGG